MQLAAERRANRASGMISRIPETMHSADSAGYAAPIIPATRKSRIEIAVMMIVMVPIKSFIFIWHRLPLTALNYYRP